MSRLVFFLRLLTQHIALAWRSLFARAPIGIATRGDDKGPPVLIYSQCAWFGPWQRPHELAVGLARMGRRVVYVAPMQVHERIGRFAHSKTLIHPPEHPNLTVFSPLIVSGEYKWPAIFRLNKRIVRRELRRLLRNEPPVDLFMNTPLGEPILDSIPHRRFVYDVMDDYSSFDWAPEGSQTMERRLLQRADTVFTGTYALKEKVSPLRPDAEFVGCGVHFERFRTAPADPPEDLRHLPRPLIGYAGTLSERIDAELLRKIAAALPQASIVLIGPVYRTMGPPPQAPNLHYLGLKPHAEMPRYMREFSVALLPFRMTEAVKAINPVKMLEYLAAGCVVVSTPIPDVVRFYSDVALIGAEAEEFIDLTRQALSTDQSARITAGIERARACSWESMVERMARAFQS